MHNLKTLSNGLTLITVNLPHLDSVTTLVAVGTGSRYETRKINGISHFLEHMFFKGSRKYPSAQQIANLVDGIGAINNAATDREVTFYWIKSSSKHVELSSDILSSMIKELLLAEEEIGKEKGVIVEELRMYRDNPQRYIWELYMRLQFGNQPLGWDIGGDEKGITSFIRGDFKKYMDEAYSPKNMALVYAGNVPRNIERMADKFFLDLPKRSQPKYKPYILQKQVRSKVNIFYKQTDQSNLILGVEAYDRYNPKRYAAAVLAVILGEGMSSRLFIQVREKRGLAYHISAEHATYKDTGIFVAYAGLKLEKIYEGIEVIRAELQRTKDEKVTEEELKKAKEMVRGRLAIRSESTNFLAEYFGTNFVIERKIETFEEFLKNIDKVSAQDIQDIAHELFQTNRFNLQIIGPFREKAKFEAILK